MPTAPATPVVAPVGDLLSAVVGQPASTAGQKYGGFSTQSQLNAAVLGGLQPIYDIRDLALAQAEQLAADVNQRYQQPTQFATAELNRTQPEIQRLEARRAVSPLATNQGLAGELIGTAYDRMIQPVKQRELKARLALEDIDKERTAEIARLAAPYAEIVDTINATPASEFAQRLAVERYGIDPSMAVGLFGPEVDIGRMREAQTLADLQMQQQMRAAGLMPGMSTVERIFQTQGPEAARAYEESQYLGELDQLGNEQFDLDLYNMTGLTVGDIGGGAPGQLVRTWASDPNNIALINDAVASVQTLPVGTDRADYIANVSQNYFTQTGDPVGAQFLANALRSLSFFGAPELDATTTWQPD